MRTLLLVLLTLFFTFLAPAADTLDVYVIDVEGGKSMLLVSPSGESLLIDVGSPGVNGRDTDRIIEAARAAGLKQIDFLVITHYDGDHMGDVPLLVSRFPVRRLVDHGPLQTAGKGVEKRYAPYAELRNKMNHLVVKPGDRIPIRGVDVQVVTAAARLIQTPLPGGGAPNPLCAGTPQEGELPQDLEDNMSIGLLFTLGRFRMIDPSVPGWLESGLPCGPDTARERGVPPG